MADRQDRILETVAFPDYVQEGDTGTLINLNCGKVISEDAVVSEVLCRCIP